MEKQWYKSKTLWGILGFTITGILNIFFPSPALTTLNVLFLGWTGYGVRDSIK